MNEKYEQVTARVKEFGQQKATLIAVSKFQPIEKIIELYQQGHRDFGENYVQELIDKATKMKEKNLNEVRFHFIGHLQTNKVKSLLPWVESIHSVDSLKLLGEINKEAEKLNKKIKCYFQINIDEEKSKSGFNVSELDLLSGEVKNFKFIIPAGLMVIPDPSASPQKAFERLVELSRKYENQLGSGKSMGMSDDYELAIQQGSTVVRVGSAIFGERQKN